MAIFSILDEIQKEMVKLLDQDKSPSKITLSVDQAFDLLESTRKDWLNEDFSSLVGQILLHRDEGRLIEHFKGLHVFGLEVFIVRLVL